MRTLVATRALGGPPLWAIFFLGGLFSACDGDKTTDGNTPDDTGRPHLDDADGDGYGAEADCDDASSAVSPGAPEVCNGIDDDCDGQADEHGATDGTRWYPDADADGFGDEPGGVLACAQPDGWVADSTDCDDGNAAISPGADEVCDTLDNDCDGVADEEGAVGGLSAHPDADGDGYGAEVGVVVCEYGDGYVANSDDCDDENPDDHPGAYEVCDNADNDCDGEVDNDARDASTFYEDGDGDNYGVETSTTEACDTPEGYAARSGDCDDDDRTTYPGADERCDGEDDDCDGEADNDAIDSNTYYTDTDGDGYGTDDTEVVTCDELSGDGVVTLGGDCDDDDTSVNPGVEETWYDGLDSDCDQASDYDQDADGYVTSAIEDEDAPTLDPGTGEVVEDGSTTEGGDCDDENRRVHPDLRERCNDVDDDCDGEIDDDAVDAETYYVDGDDDGFGDDATAETLCDAPDYDYMLIGGDCDDTDAEVSPDADEACGDADGIDNDCDAVVDEECYTGEVNLVQVAGTDPDDYDCDIWWDAEWTESGDMCPDCDYGFVTELTYNEDISDNTGRCVDPRDPDYTWLVALDLDYEGTGEAMLWYGSTYDYDYDYDDEPDYDYGAAPPAYTYWRPQFYAEFDETTGALSFHYGYFYAWDEGSYTYYYGSSVTGTADLAGLGG